MLLMMPTYMCLSCKRNFVVGKGEEQVNAFCPPCERSREDGFTFAGTFIFGHASISVGIAWDGRLMLSCERRPEFYCNGTELARVVHHVLGLPDGIEIHWTKYQGESGWIARPDGSGFVLYGYRMHMLRGQG